MPAVARPRIYLRVSDGGLGMHSVAATAPAANAASWHSCIPHILKRIELPTVSALTTASPWCAASLPACTLQIQLASGDPAAIVGDPDISASQRTLASAPLAAAAVKTRALVATTGRAAQAAFRSAGGPGSAGWLLPPSLAPHFLSDPCFRIAVRTRLDLDIPCQVGVCQHRDAAGTLCGEALDAKGQHARSCRKGGWLVKKHNSIVDEVAVWCDNNSAYTIKEAILPNANPDHPEARIDLIV